MHTEFSSENLKRRTGSEDNIKRYINEIWHADEDWAERLGTGAKEQGNDSSRSKNGTRISLLAE
jgi:hypothetical protein